MVTVNLIIAVIAYNQSTSQLVHTLLRSRISFPPVCVGPSQLLPKVAQIRVHNNLPTRHHKSIPTVT